MLCWGDEEREEQVVAKSLGERLKEIPDPRSRRGRRYPLPGRLILGALNGERSLPGMWGSKRWAERARPLGFLGHPHPPVYNMVCFS